MATEPEQAALDVADTPEVVEPDPLPPAEKVASTEIDVIRNIGVIQLQEIAPGVEIVTSLGYEPPPPPPPAAVDLKGIEQRARLLAVGKEGSQQQMLKMADKAMLMLTAADMGFPPAWGLTNLYTFREGQTPQLTGSGWLAIIERQPDMIVAWHEREPDVCDATGYRLGRQPYHCRVTYQDAVEMGWTRGKDGTSNDSTVWKHGLASKTHLEWAVAKIIGRKLLSDVVYAHGIIVEDQTVIDTVSAQVASAPAAVGDGGHKAKVDDAKWAIRSLVDDNPEKARELWDQVVTDESDPEQIEEAVGKAQALSRMKQVRWFLIERPLWATRRFFKRGIDWGGQWTLGYDMVEWTLHRMRHKMADAVFGGAPLLSWFRDQALRGCALRGVPYWQWTFVDDRLIHRVTGSFAGHLAKTRLR